MCSGRRKSPIDPLWKRKYLFPFLGGLREIFAPSARMILRLNEVSCFCDLMRLKKLIYLPIASTPLPSISVRILRL
jgi:hypothetical protein